MEAQFIKFSGPAGAGTAEGQKLSSLSYRSPICGSTLTKAPQAAEFVKQVNRGLRRVPMIIFPDGSILVEPDSDTLREKLRKFQPNPS